MRSAESSEPTAAQQEDQGVRWLMCVHGQCHTMEFAQHFISCVHVNQGLVKSSLMWALTNLSDWPVLSSLKLPCAAGNPLCYYTAQVFEKCSSIEAGAFCERGRIFIEGQRVWGKCFCRIELCFFRVLVWAGYFALDCAVLMDFNPQAIFDSWSHFWHIQS